MRKKAAEYKKHQMAMHDVIVRLAPGIEGLIFDLCTSRREITDLGFPASRFPYYLGTSVVTLCGELNMSRLGQWALKADFCFGSGRVKFGRSKGSSTSYKPFDLTVGGVAIPHLSADDRKKINGKADLHTIQANYEATCSCSTVTQDQAQALAIGFTVLGEGYEAYQKDSKTYQISMGMASSSKDYNKMALFTMAELVLKDVQQSPLGSQKARSLSIRSQPRLQAYSPREVEGLGLSCLQDIDID